MTSRKPIEFAGTEEEQTERLGQSRRLLPGTSSWQRRINGFGWPPGIQTRYGNVPWEGAPDLQES